MKVRINFALQSAVKNYDVVETKMYFNKSKIVLKIKKQYFVQTLREF